MSYKIRLEIFEGPLDLLLYLIKKDELDIYDIPITRVTEQYLEYLNIMEQLDLEVAGDFLVMAATLMHIKSKMLLPPDPNGEVAEELDPRAELVRRLLEYKAFKEVAEDFKGFEERRSGIFTRYGIEPEIEDNDSPFVEVSIFDLMTAFAKILKGLPQTDPHEVTKDEFTVADKVHELVHQLTKQASIRFSALFKKSRNKYEAITIFLAILELARLKEILVLQSDYFGDIEISRNAEKIQPAGE